MVRYRRNFVGGGTYFFTVTLADRASRTLVDHIDALRTAFQTVQHAHPFVIDAVVILPDHFHVVMTLPQDDANFSTRLRLIKSRFTSAVEKAGVSSPPRGSGERTLWQRRFWEHTIRDERDARRLGWRCQPQFRKLWRTGVSRWS
jgi:putative transposase